MTVGDHMEHLAKEVRETWLEYAIYIVELELAGVDQKEMRDRIVQKLRGTIERLGTKREQQIDLDQNDGRRH
jgi:hypothetical protein